MLDIDENANQVWIMLCVAVGQRTVPLARDVGQGSQAKGADLAAAASTQNKFIEARACGGRRECRDRRLPAWRYYKRSEPAGTIRSWQKIFQGRERLDGADLGIEQSTLVARAQVRHERDIAPQITVFEAELVVQAPITFEVEGEEQILKRRGRDTCGKRIGSQHEVLHLPQISVGISDDFKERIGNAKNVEGILARQFIVLRRPFILA